MKGKKGSGQDILFVGIGLVAFAIIVMVGFKIYTEIDTKFQESDVLAAADIDGKARSSSAQMLNIFPGAIDNSFLFLTIGLCIATLILAAMVRVHPIFLVFYIILLSIVIFLCAVFSNIYQTMAAEAEMTAIADSLMFTSLIMNTLPFIVGIFGTILAIVMYKAFQEAVV